MRNFCDFFRVLQGNPGFFSNAPGCSGENSIGGWFRAWPFWNSAISPKKKFTTYIPRLAHPKVPFYRIGSDESFPTSGRRFKHSRLQAVQGLAMATTTSPETGRRFKSPLVDLRPHWVEKRAPNNYMPNMLKLENWTASRKWWNSYDDVLSACLFFWALEGSSWLNPYEKYSLLMGVGS